MKKRLEHEMEVSASGVGFRVKDLRLWVQDVDSRIQILGCRVRRIVEILKK